MERILNAEDIYNISENDIRELFDDIEFAEHANNIVTKESNESCINCHTSDNIVDDYINGIRVCRNCGQVLEGLFDSNPEWKQYGEDGGASELGRCSMPVNKLLPQSSLGTSIGGGNWKSRLKTLHGWSAMPYKERSLNLVFKEIQSKCAQAHLLKCIEDDAKIMYKSISECKHMKGKNKGKSVIIRGINRKSLIGACVFFACKRKNVTRSPKEISDLFKLKYTEMTKGCKNFLRLIKVRKMELNMGSSYPEHFVVRFCNELKLKTQFIEKAVQIAKNIKKLNVASDHTPYSIATGSILIMAEINNISTLTKKSLAVSFGVSEVTIAKAYKKIDQYKHILVDNDKTNEIAKKISDEMDSQNVPDAIKDRLLKFGITLSDSTKKMDIDLEDLDLDHDELEDGIDILDDLDENYTFDDIRSNFELYINDSLYELYLELENTNRMYEEVANNYYN
jgi:transcription initiation factor TFIIB